MRGTLKVQKRHRKGTSKAQKRHIKVTKSAQVRLGRGTEYKHES
jgi:hypothetical protein